MSLTARQAAKAAGGRGNGLKRVEREGGGRRTSLGQSALKLQTAGRPILALSVYD